MTGSSIEGARTRFPALALTHDGRTIRYFDGPGATQTPASVAEAVSNNLLHENANVGSRFEGSLRSSGLLHRARQTFRDFLGASDEMCISFGQNMSSLVVRASQVLAPLISDGDVIVVTEFDHDSNTSPWLRIARDRGATVRVVRVYENSGVIDFDDFASAMNDHPRVVALGWASNVTGSVNPVRELLSMARNAGAITVLDAVHWAPHGSIDVGQLGADIVACSVYKFFGPHLGVLYVDGRLRETLAGLSLGPADDPFEIGTQSYEALAGAIAAVEYLSELAGSPFTSGERDLRRWLQTAFGHVRRHEQDVFTPLFDGLMAMPGVRIIGIKDSDLTYRTPTVSFTKDGKESDDVARALWDVGSVRAGSGTFYSTRLLARMRAGTATGVVRLGVSHYNTHEDVDRVLESMRRL